MAHTSRFGMTMRPAYDQVLAQISVEDDLRV